MAGHARSCKCVIFEEAVAIRLSAFPKGTAAN